MPRTPPKPLVTSTGRVTLTPYEIDFINHWLDAHEEAPGMQLFEPEVADVLRRLLGHAAGTMTPEPDVDPDVPAVAPVSDDQAARLEARSQEFCRRRGLCVKCGERLTASDPLGDTCFLCQLSATEPQP